MKKYYGIIGVLLVWELMRLITRSPLISSALDILKYLVFHLPEVYPHIIASVGIILAGFSFALFVGFSLGVLIAYSKIADTVLMPIVDALRPVSAIALFPLFIVLFGLGMRSKIAIIFWTAWSAILLNTVEGLRKVDKNVIEAGKMDGANRYNLFKNLSLPLASPVIMTGLRIGMSGAWISLVASEMLGSNEGLGFFVLIKSQSFEYPAMYAGILIISLVGLAMNRLLYYIQIRIEKEVL